MPNVDLVRFVQHLSNPREEVQLNPLCQKLKMSMQNEGSFPLHVKDPIVINLDVDVDVNAITMIILIILMICMRLLRLIMTFLHNFQNN